MTATPSAADPIDLTPAKPLLPRDHRAYPLLAALLVLVFVARTAPYVWTFSHTFDEPSHLGSAVALYEDHRHLLDVTHPPVARLVAGFPLWARGWMHVPLPFDARVVQNEETVGDTGNAILFHGPASYESVLATSRLAMLVFPALALVFAYGLGAWAAGGRAGLLAVAMLSLDPTLLGHAFWVCTDVAAVTGSLAAFYYGMRWVDRPSAARAAMFGAAFGLAVACKFSCVFVAAGVGAVAVLGMLPPFAAARGAAAVPWTRQRVVNRGTEIAIAAIAAFVFLWATYLFDVGRIGSQVLFVNRAEFDHLPHWLKATPVPMPAFALGWFYLLGHGKVGHPTYLNGHLSKFGWPSYFPEAMLLKEPVAVLVTFAIAAALFAWMLTTPRGRALAWRPMALLILGGLFLALCVVGHIDIGFRHALPFLACFYVAAAAVLSQVRRGTAVLLVLIGVTIVETAPSQPDYLSYFNVLAGGPRNADRYLVDSNLDWGQDVKRLADWLHSPAAGGRHCVVRYFGSSKPQTLDHFGIDPDELKHLPHGLFAISKSVRRRLDRFYVDRLGRVTFGPGYDWLDAYRPVAHIGDSIDVYDLVPTTRPTADRKPVVDGGG